MNESERLRLTTPWPGARRWAVPALLLALALPAAPAWAQDAEVELGWKNATELGFVLTSGNSNTSNFNVRNLFTYDWEQADIDWELGILRAASGDDRVAVGSEDDFELIDPDAEPDNQRLYTNARYRRNLNPDFFWYGRLFFERDEPADIDYRYTPSAGAGNSWVRRDDLRFITGYGVSYTRESFALEGASSFAGYQVFYDLFAQLTDSTDFESKMTFDGSFENAGKYRFDWYNGAGVDISSRMALKASFRIVYRNQPALEAIDLENDAGVVIGSVVVQKQKIDTALTTSLVINF